MTPRELKRLYDNGENISLLLRKEAHLQHNTENIIEIAYDLQAGSYIAGMAQPEMARFMAQYTAEISRRIGSLCRPESILEAGVGEATTLSGVLESLAHDGIEAYGFDISWSRVACGKQWLQSCGLGGDVHLCTGSLLNIPFADNSIDVVYTSHSIEPNRGRETPILRELFRVARRYLILLEPAYELADEKARERMDLHGYCRNLVGTAKSLGYNLLAHELFPNSVNPANPTAITVIEKRNNQEQPNHVLACPRFKTPLTELQGMLFSSEALAVYPVLHGIPCLRIENAITASRYPEFINRRES